MTIETAMFSSILQVLPILGLGSLLTLLVQSWLRKKERQADRLFEEKKEAFLGLLQAIGEYVASRNEENRINLAYWRMRCEIVCGSSTRKATIRRLDEGVAYPDEAHDEMLSAIRNELGITS